MPLIPGGGRARRRAAANSSKSLLSQSDFTYLGTYPFEVAGDNVYGKGMTHRYVSGQLEIVSMGLHSGDAEPQKPNTWSLPASYGQNMVANHTFYEFSNFWGGAWGVVDPHQSLWWDEENDLIWTGSTLDYPQGGFSPSSTAVLAARTVPISGACTNWTGWRGFQGIGARAAFGRVQRVPSWFRTLYGLPEYVSLSGGYTSLMNQGLGASMGPMFFFFPDPFTYAAATVGGTDYSVPSADFVIHADFRSGTTAYDWYSTSTPSPTSYANRGLDRGVRLSAVDNYYDAESDARGENPSVPPSVPPLSTGNWLSPCSLDPQEYGRWTWGDSFHGSGNWIDGTTKHGIVTIATIATGKNYYMSSAGYSDGRTCELHVYDPEALVAVGDNWKVRPSSLFVLSDIASYFNSSSNAERIDASYDSTTGKLFLMHYFGQSGGNAKNFLHVYQVAA